MLNPRMRKEKGMFLISSYLLLSVIGTFSLALFMKGATLHQTMERTQNRITAFHLAESGIDRAIARLRTDSTYTGWGYTALGKGGYEVTVESPDPLNNPTVRRITATGHTPNNASTSRAYERRIVVAYVNVVSQSPFDFGLFAASRIRMSGNTMTDSYDSRRGAYNPGAARSSGDIGTNGIRRGSIRLSGTSRVKGDAVVGPLGNVSTAIRLSPHARIEGGRSAATAPNNLPRVEIPSGLTNLGSLRIDGNGRMILGGGSYWYSSIRISGNGKLEFAGPATIYVDGRVKIAGNEMGTRSNLPTNLTIKVKGHKRVSISGNGNFYGVIYAPDARVSVSGNSQLFGGLVGDKIAISSNGKVHYDEALGTASSGAGPRSNVQMRSWQEV